MIIKYFKIYSSWRVLMSKGFVVQVLQIVLRGYVDRAGNPAENHPQIFLQHLGF